MTLENNENWKDILTREYKKDFASLTNDEINLMIRNMFYQYFMIELDSIQISSKLDEYGNFVTLVLHGEVFRDSDNLPNYLVEDIAEDEYYEDEDY